MKTENRTFFVADAAEVLKRLDDAQFSMVYLDPPWNTRTTDAFDREVSHAQLASENRSAAHEEMIGSVIQQCHRLLTEDGALYFHAPSVSSTNFRLILDQVFGKEPSLTIVWKKGGPAGAPKFERSNHEEILRYTKSHQAVYNPLRKPSESTLFHQTDEHGAFRLVDLTVAGDRPQYQFSLGSKGPPVGRSWRFSSARMSELAAEGRIVISASGLPRLKLYWDEQTEGASIGSVWDDIPPSAAQGIHYPGAKPTELVKRLILQGSDPGCMILDPFAGSGQLIAQADLLGRHWTGVDSSADALNATHENLELTCSLKGDALCVINAEQVAAMQPVVTEQRRIFLNVQELNQTSMRLARQTKAKYLERLEHELHWFTALDPKSRDFLATAAYIFDTLDEALDFSVVSVCWWKALENELAAKLFEPFRKWFNTRGLSVEEKAWKYDVQNKWKYFKIIKLLNFLSGSPLPVGQMRIVLEMLTDHDLRLKLPTLRVFSAFAGECFARPEFLNTTDGLTKFITKAAVDEYRNGGAHTSLYDKKRTQGSMEYVKGIFPEVLRGLQTKV